jgi:hypothetical protein
MLDQMPTEQASNAMQSRCRALNVPAGIVDVMTPALTVSTSPNSSDQVKFVLVCEA